MCVVFALQAADLKKKLDLIPPPPPPHSCLRLLALGNKKSGLYDITVGWPPCAVQGYATDLRLFRHVYRETMQCLQRPTTTHLPPLGSSALLHLHRAQLLGNKIKVWCDMVTQGTVPLIAAMVCAYARMRVHSCLCVGVRACTHRLRARMYSPSVIACFSPLGGGWTLLMKTKARQRYVYDSTGNRNQGCKYTIH